MERKDNDTLGYLLRRVRRRYDVSQSELAQMISVSVSSVSAYERNERMIPVPVLIDLVRALHCSQEEVILLVSKRVYETQKRMLEDIYPGIEVTPTAPSIVFHDQYFSGVPVEVDRRFTVENDITILIDILSDYQFGQSMYMRDVYYQTHLGEYSEEDPIPGNDPIYPRPTPPQSPSQG